MPDDPWANTCLTRPAGHQHCRDRELHLGLSVQVGEVNRRPVNEAGAYELTPAGADLIGIIDALSTWGERWLEVTTEHTDPGFVLWSWARYYLNPADLPKDRVLPEFTLDEPARTAAAGSSQRTAPRSFAIRIRVETDLYVTARSEAFTRWHLGVLGWRDALADGSIEVLGPRALALSMPGWNRHAERRREASPAPHRSARASP